MYLVTGGAGFIGSHLVRALNERGVTNILVVDDLTRGAKCANLADCQIADFIDREEFFQRLEAGRLDRSIKRIFHQGACTDTLERNGRELLRLNFTFSKLLLRNALTRGIPFVYASSAAIYGNATAFTEDPPNERPLNPYGYSKLVFDQHVRRILPRAETPVVGLRYFNVYGPREQHKGRMASMVYHVYDQLERLGAAQLFQGTAGWGDGEQRRDFVYVEDVVRANLFFGDASPPRRGIFNVGSGTSISFNDLVRRVGAHQGGAEIEYVPCPDRIFRQYQSYTEADLTRLRAAGYHAAFTPIEVGLAKSVAAWSGGATRVEQPA